VVLTHSTDLFLVKETISHIDEEVIRALLSFFTKLSKFDFLISNIIIVNNFTDGLDFWNQTANYLVPVLDKNGTYSTVKKLSSL
jgi:hypothetical protein